jgi:hypothetical protein
MKHILIIIGLFALLGLFFHTKDKEKNSTVNPATGLELIEDNGRYSLKSENGTVHIGTIKKARKTLFEIWTSFANDSIDTGEQTYKIKTDNEGRYVVLVGLGSIKVRPSDANLFLGVIEGKLIGNGTRTVIKNGTEIFSSFWRGLTNEE